MVEFTPGFLAAASLLAVSAVEARSACPLRSPGVVSEQAPTGARFFSTASAEPLADGPANIELTASEARLAAKAQLRQDQAVPKARDGRLRGVTEEGECWLDGRVYVTLSVDEDSVRQAEALDSTIENSMKSTPTPLLKSGNTQDDTESNNKTFDKLMKNGGTYDQR